MPQLENRVRQISGCGFLLIVFSLFTAHHALAATLYVNAESTNAIAPYTGWNTAARNIQDAIDVSVDGDQVLVTNGVYVSGGKAISSNLTNRVTLDKAITVQSVNGPWFTFIVGNGATNGLSAVRCAWVTNEAVLSGFTITGGATRTSGDLTNLLAGGGVWCISSNAVVRNCIIVSNVAAFSGGGVFQGNLVGCALLGNRVNSFGSAASYASLLNCTVVSNFNSSVQALFNSKVTNSISYYNEGGDSSLSTFSYCCVRDSVSGPGVFHSAPLLTIDNIHISGASPCRSSGTNLSTGVDIDGQSWAAPPSIGCDEWQAFPTIVGPPSIRFGQDPSNFAVNVAATGQEPLDCFWMRNGSLVNDDNHFNSSHTTNLLVSGISPEDAGTFQVVVSNSVGVVTSAVTTMVVHYVHLQATNPMPPFSSWSTAATNIQDAINSAASGDVVLVTNGTYAVGGKVMIDDLTNRIALDKPIRVQSVNGPWVTTILGNGATNGATAARVAWLGEGASLVGFTLSGGATRTTGGSQNGGGVWCSSSNAFVSNCYIKGNTANNRGSGIYQGTLGNSLVISNSAPVINNGAIYGANAVNCTVLSNSTVGAVASFITNCIVYYNNSALQSSFASYCCLSSTVATGGNFTNAPRFFVDGIRPDNTSPCLGAGTNIAAGVDIFGQPWANPPTVGCAEQPRTPLISSTAKIQLTNSPIGFKIGFAVTGVEPFMFSWLKNGIPIQDDGHFNFTHTTNLMAKGVGLSDAGNYQIVVSNIFGVTTSQVAPLVIHCVDAANANPAPPYLSWASAATTIQDAIEAAAAGEIVLVTNGIYATGGKAVVGGLTNRIVLDKALLVASMNGYAVTKIQGARDPSTTNGPLAVRCAWLGDGAQLIGFTLQGGATHGGSSLTFEEQCGGGVWAANSNAILSNCVLTNNSSRWYGGGAQYATLNNCLVTRNESQNGGGVAFSTLNNCTICNNKSATGLSGGSYQPTARNSIIFGNDTQNSPIGNYFAGNFVYTCSSPTPPGTGNTNFNLQFLDALCHLPATSPCRGIGSPLYAWGTDADGESWLIPPSMGWDEVVETNLVGPLSLQINQSFQFNLENHIQQTVGQVSGRVSRLDWSMGDGTIFTNTTWFVWYTWTNAGDHTITFTAYNYDHPEGVSTNLLVHVDPVALPELQSAQLVNNAFKFSFPMQGGIQYSIYYATNLTPPVTWQVLQYVYGFSNSVFQFNDNSTTNAARFYRVVAY